MSRSSRRFSSVFRPWTPPSQQDSSSVGLRPQASEGYRVQGKDFFLTWSSTPLGKTEALALLLERLGATNRRCLTRVCLSQEHHSDGTLHLHGVVRFSERRNFVNPRWADLGTVHGRYELCRSWIASETYLMKEDPTPLIQTFGTTTTVSVPTVPQGPREKPTEAVARMLTAGSTISEVRRLYPAFVMLHLAKLKAFVQELRQTTASAIRRPCLKILSSHHHLVLDVMQWLCLNLPPAVRQHRQPQLFIRGFPGCGKTTMVLDLETEYRIFRPCLTNRYWDGFNDDIELIVFDEFQGNQIDFSLLKVLLDGQPCTLPCRYSDFSKIKNTPVIILCNNPPFLVYEKLFQKRDVCFTEFQERITFIDLTFLHVPLHIFKH
jgi:hypothetical protein